MFVICNLKAIYFSELHCFSCECWLLSMRKNVESLAKRSPFFDENSYLQWNNNSLEEISLGHESYVLSFTIGVGVVVVAAGELKAKLLKFYLVLLGTWFCTSCGFEKFQFAVVNMQSNLFKYSAHFLNYQ